MPSDINKPSTFEQLVKMQTKSEGAYRSMPTELSREMSALCSVLDRKFQGVRAEAEATRKRLNTAVTADHAE